MPGAITAPRGRMIGLLDVLPPPSGDAAGTFRLETLPPPPAPRLSGLIARCRDAHEARRTLEWYDRVRSSRPEFPLGLVCASAACVDALSRCRFPVEALVAPAELCAGGVPGAAMDAVRAAAVESRILEELVQRHGTAILEALPTLKITVAQAVRGGTVQAAARELGVTRDTVRRRLKAVGLSAGLLMAKARLRAFDLRIEMGYDRGSALVTCGWSSHDARRKARSRAAPEAGI
jgi:acyl-coenzyme A thioesterase PaaI-like protein